MGHFKTQRRLRRTVAAGAFLWPHLRYNNVTFLGQAIIGTAPDADIARPGP
jgi:hypothetical protein